MSEEEKPVTLMIGTKWHYDTIYTSILLLQITHSPQSLVPYGTKSQVSTGSIELDFLQDLFAAARYIDQLLLLGDRKMYKGCIGQCTQNYAFKYSTQKCQIREL